MGYLFPAVPPDIIATTAVFEFERVDASIVNPGLSIVIEKLEIYSPGLDVRSNQLESPDPFCSGA